VNLERVLEELEIPFKRPGESPHVSTGWLGLICPHCGQGSSNYGLGINTSSLAVKCWKCGKHRLYETLRICARIDAKRLGGVLLTLTAERPAERTLGASKCVLPAGVGPFGLPHKRFLRERGFDPVYVRDVWSVQGIGFAGTRYDWSLFMPAVLNGEVVSWCARGVGDDKRYDAAKPEMEKVPLKSMLYGEHLCSHSVAVNEGQLDAWAVGPGGVATCGVGYTDMQLLRIAKFPVRLIVFDSEREAQKRAEELCRALAPFPGTTRNVVLSGKDASRSPKGEIKELRRMLA